MSNRRGSISMPIVKPEEPVESKELKGLKSIKVELDGIQSELNKTKGLIKPCRCRCNEVENKLQQQIDLIGKKIQELIEN